MPEIEGPRPDQAQWARMNVGLASPMLLPFMVAAGAGAAWWAYVNWARTAMAPWMVGQGSGGAAQPAPTAAPEPEAARPAAAAAPPETPPQADNDDDGADAIDAAYAANLGPVPSPDEPRAKGKRASDKAAKQPAAKTTKNGRAKGKGR